jgi:HK97 family phage prohead protease
MNDEIERRIMQNVSLRAAGQPQQPIIAGSGAVFNQITDLGAYSEVIEPGFFDDVLGDDVRGLWNHNDNIVLGRTKNGTMSISQTAAGLDYEIRINLDDGEAMSKYAKIARGDVDQSSFAFTVKSLANGDAMNGDAWEMSGKTLVRRLLKGGAKQLFDVSPVAFPAYEGTSVSARSKADALARQIPKEISGGQAPAVETPPTKPQILEAQVRIYARKRQIELASILSKE